VTRIFACAGVDTLYAAADAHLASHDVQVFVCLALLSIAYSSAEARETLRAGRAVEVITRAKAAHPSAQEVRSNANCALGILAGINHSNCAP